MSDIDYKQHMTDIIELLNDGGSYPVTDDITLSRDVFYYSDRDVWEYGFFEAKLQRTPENNFRGWPLGISSFVIRLDPHNIRELLSNPDIIYTKISRFQEVQS